MPKYGHGHLCWGQLENHGYHNCLYIAAFYDVGLFYADNTGRIVGAVVGGLLGGVVFPAVIVVLITFLCLYIQKERIMKVHCRYLWDSCMYTVDTLSGRKQW